jgi:hypothetical protein
MKEGEGAKVAKGRHGSKLRLLLMFFVYSRIYLLVCIDPKYQELLKG